MAERRHRGKRAYETGEFRWDALALAEQYVNERFKPPPSVEAVTVVDSDGEFPAATVAEAQAQVEKERTTVREVAVKWMGIVDEAVYEAPVSLAYWQLGGQWVLNLFVDTDSQEARIGTEEAFTLYLDRRLEKPPTPSTAERVVAEARDALPLAPPAQEQEALTPTPSVVTPTHVEDDKPWWKPDPASIAQNVYGSLVWRLLGLVVVGAGLAYAILRGN